MKSPYYLWFLMIFCQPGFGVNPQDAYWECELRDTANKVWSSKNQYRRAAINFALAACKKESTMPLSCRQTAVVCGGYNQMRTYTRPSGWRCTAFDRMAHPWRSPLNSSLDKAAFRAMALCKKRSRVPYTCFLNFVTCELRN